MESPLGRGICCRLCGDVAVFAGGGCCDAPEGGPDGEAEDGGGGGGGGGPPEDADAPPERVLGALDVESARRRLRPERSVGSGSADELVGSPSSLPSSSLVPMDSPPGTFGGGAGCAGECGTPEVRPKGVPTGMAEGS
jgi:hypothetical protein